MKLGALPGDAAPLAAPAGTTNVCNEVMRARARQTSQSTGFKCDRGGTGRTLEAVAVGETGWGFHWPVVGSITMRDRPWTCADDA